MHVALARQISISAFVSILAQAPGLAQGMPPTPLFQGASVEFMSLANPDTSEEKISIYALYYLREIDPNERPVRVKRLLLGEALVPATNIIESTNISEAEAIAMGVSQSDIDDIREMTNTSIRYTRYRHRIDLSIPPTPAEYRSSASVNFTVLPAIGADTGIVTITDTLGYKRYFSVPLSPGVPCSVTVNGMEAGVATFNIKLVTSGSEVANGTQTFTLRKDFTRTIALPETNQSAVFPLAQIQRILLTQGSQNDEGTGVLVAGRKARLKVLFWDPQSRTYNCQSTLRANLPNGTSQTVPFGYNGLVHFNNVEFQFETDISSELMQPGTTFTLETRLADGTLLSRTYAPDIREGRRLTLHVYEVSPGPSYSGVPVARDAVGLREQVVKWAEAQLPVSGFDIDIRPGFWHPASMPPSPYPWSDPGYIKWDMATLAGLMDTIAAAEGHPRTDGHIYLAMINGRYAQAGTLTGITGGKGFPGIAMFMFSQENARLTLTHEIGHTHWLGHAPSPGATSDPNPVDWEYPYGGDGMIAFAPWNAISGTSLPTTNKDVMAYSWSQQWISDFNWVRFFDRTFDSAFRASGASAATALLPKSKPGSPMVIGAKEAQSLADYLDALSPMACGSIAMADLEAAKIQLRLSPISPIPAGKPSVLVHATTRPKREIHGPAAQPHAPTELELLLDMPSAPTRGLR